MEHSRIIIVGAGFSGLGMAVRLKQQGIDEFVVLERADEVGGTWRDNDYPGLTCDVPSHLYSFSFAPNPNWSATHSPRDDLWDYLRDCADRFGVRPHVRFSCEMEKAAWDEDANEWRVQTSDGPITAQVLIVATGPFSEPYTPRLPGLERFTGAVFHSARWDHDHDFAGQRVAVIGTGASAIQIIPAIQPRVERLLVFQRTPPWVFPKAERRLTRFEHRLYRRLPSLQRLARAGDYLLHEVMTLGFLDARLIWPVELIARLHLRLQVRDRTLRDKLRPQHRFGCKRVLNSNQYYGVFTKPNVDLITNGIHEIRERSIVGANGAEHEIDTLVLATGFHLNDPPARRLIWGRNGSWLGDIWRDSRFALRGTTIAGFPNLFWLVGPNTGVGTTSIIHQIESQATYVLDCLRVMAERNVVSVEARPEAQEAFNRWLDDRLRTSVWTAGCRSHYQDPSGRVTGIWPGTTVRFRHETRRFDPAEYSLQAASGAGADGRVAHPRARPRHSVA